MHQFQQHLHHYEDPLDKKETKSCKEMKFKLRIVTIQPFSKVFKQEHASSIEDLLISTGSS